MTAQQKTTDAPQASIEQQVGKIYSTTVKFTALEAMYPNMANSIQAVMDRNYIESTRKSWVFVSPENVPQHGWNFVDRKNGKVTKISEAQAYNLEWHERLYVNQSAINTAKEMQPLSLLIDYNNLMGHLYLEGLYRFDDAAKVALREQSKPSKTATQETDRLSDLHKDAEAVESIMPNLAPAMKPEDFEKLERLVRRAKE